MNGNEFCYFEIHKKISHLTEMQINELIKRYYNDEKIGTLLDEFNIKARPSELVGLFPPVIYSDEVCIYCDASMISYRKSRSDNGNPKIICPKCNHINSMQCACEQCRLIRRTEQEAELKRKKELVKEKYSLDKVQSVEFNTLNFRGRIYLGALLRAGIEEDYSKIKALSLQDAKLSPTSEMSKEIILSLFYIDVIKIHPSSPVDAFGESEENGYPDGFYHSRVNLHINVTSEDDRRQMLDQLMNPSDDDFLHITKEEMLKIWREVALNECLEYLLYNMKQVKFEFSIGEKTISVLNDLLDVFSTSQIFAIIYRSVSNASRFYLEKKVTRQHAANSVIGSCQRYGEKALANDWGMKGFGRNFDCPQSIVSEFLYNRVLKIGSRGFDQIPSLSVINSSFMNSDEA
jgi:hypothetical protein